MTQPKFNSILIQLATLILSISVFGYLTFYSYERYGSLWISLFIMFIAIIIDGGLFALGNWLYDLNEGEFNETT